MTATAFSPASLSLQPSPHIAGQMAAPPLRSSIAPKCPQDQMQAFPISSSQALLQSHRRPTGSQCDPLQSLSHCSGSFFCPENPSSSSLKPVHFLHDAKPLPKEGLSALPCFPKKPLTIPFTVILPHNYPRFSVGLSPPPGPELVWTCPRHPVWDLAPRRCAKCLLNDQQTE